MENKINVAELLRKCPEGMELDCTLFSRPLKYSGFEGFQDAYPIRTVAENGEIIWFTKEGCAHNNMYSKCVIFPKGKTSWEGFVPPYPFKDGDICYIKTKSNEHIFIFNCIGNYGIKRYANLTKHGFYKDYVSVVCTEKVIEEFRLATEEEKEKFFKVIKDFGYKWNAETKTLEKIIKPKFKVGDTIKEVQGNKKGTITEFYDSGFYVVKRNEGFTSYINIIHQDHWELFIDKFDINTLKPFEQVLVRDTIADKWHIQFFEKYNNTQHFPFKCILSEYKQCVPYKGNEHLLDTKDECIDYYKTWE